MSEQAARAFCWVKGAYGVTLIKETEPSEFVPEEMLGLPSDEIT